MITDTPDPLKETAAPVRAWQEDVQGAASVSLFPAPGSLLPEVDVDVLLNPPDPFSWRVEFSTPGVENPTHPGALPSVARSRQAPTAPRPSSEVRPASAARPVPRPPAGSSGVGGGAARVAALLQRHEGQNHAKPFGQVPDVEPPLDAPPPVGEFPRTVVPLPGRQATLRRRMEAARMQAVGRPVRVPSLGSLEDAVAGRLRSWAEGVDVPSLPRTVMAQGVAQPKRAAAAPKTASTSGVGLASSGVAPRPPAVPTAAGALLRSARQPSAAPEATPGGSRHLARLIGLVEQAAGDLAAMERRLADLAAREPAPEAQQGVQWLEDDELAGRLQGILARQARQRGIDLS